jgi:phage virion morphogenesis protein
MAGLSIKLDVTGDLEKFAGRLERLGKPGVKQQLNTQIAQALENSTLERFKTGTDPDGGAWKPSGRVQAENAKRRKSGKSGKTLVDTGRLRNSIHSASSDDAAEVGTDVVYARIHQLGGDAGRNHATKLAARPYLGMSADDERVVRAVVEGFVEEMLR